MKRWIATILVLALLALLGAPAMAEDNAAVLMLDNVRVQSGDQTVDVQDLAVSLVLENVGDLPALALLIDGAGEPLATAIAQLTTQQLIIEVDGMDYGYAAGLPSAQAAQLAQVGQAGLAQLIPALLPMLNEMTLPTFTGADIPRLDLTGVLSEYITMTGNGTSEFEIPAGVIDDLLDQALQLARAQGKNLSQLDTAIELLEGLKAEGKGIAIKGTIADDGSVQKIDGDILLINGKGKTSNVAGVSFISAMNSWRLAVSVRKGFLTLNVVTASLISRPAENRVDFGFSVFGGVDFSMALFTEDGLQKVTFVADGLGERARLEFDWGRQADGDLVSLAAQFSDVDLSMVLKTAVEADGARTGSFVWGLTNGDSAAGLSADVTMYTGEGIDLSGIAIPEDLRPIDQFDADAVAAAFKPVSEYISSHTSLS